MFVLHTGFIERQSKRLESLVDFPLQKSGRIGLWQVNTPERRDSSCLQELLEIVWEDDDWEASREAKADTPQMAKRKSVYSLYAGLRARAKREGF